MAEGGSDEFSGRLGLIFATIGAYELVHVPPPR